MHVQRLFSTGRFRGFFSEGRRYWDRSKQSLATQVYIRNDGILLAQAHYDVSGDYIILYSLTINFA